MQDLHFQLLKIPRWNVAELECCVRYALRPKTNNWFSHSYKATYLYILHTDILGTLMYLNMSVSQCYLCFKMAISLYGNIYMHVIVLEYAIKGLVYSLCCDLQKKSLQWVAKWSRDQCAFYHKDVHEEYFGRQEVDSEKCSMYFVWCWVWHLMQHIHCSASRLIFVKKLQKLLDVVRNDHWEMNLALYLVPGGTVS